MKSISRLPLKVHIDSALGAINVYFLYVLKKWTRCLLYFSAFLILSFVNHFVGLNQAQASERNQESRITDCSALVQSELSENGQRLLNLILLQLKETNSVDEIKSFTGPIFSNEMAKNPFLEGNSTSEAQLAGATDMFLSHVTQTDWELIRVKLRKEINDASDQIGEISEIDEVTSSITGFDPIKIHNLGGTNFISHLDTLPTFVTGSDGEHYILTYESFHSLGNFKRQFVNRVYKYNDHANGLEFQFDLMDLEKPTQDLLSTKVSTDSIAFGNNQLFGILDTDSNTLIQIDLNSGKTKELYKFSKNHPQNHLIPQFYHASETEAYFQWKFIDDGDDQTFSSYFKINKTTGDVIEIGTAQYMPLLALPPIRDKENTLHWLNHDLSKKTIISSYNVKTAEFHLTDLGNINNNVYPGPAIISDALADKWIRPEFDRNSKNLIINQIDPISMEIETLESFPMTEEVTVFLNTKTIVDNEGNLLIGILYQNNFTDKRTLIIKLDIPTGTMTLVSDTAFDSHVGGLAFISGVFGEIYLLTLPANGHLKLHHIADDDIPSFLSAPEPFTQMLEHNFKYYTTTRLKDGGLLILGRVTSGKLGTIRVRTGQKE